MDLKAKNESVIQRGRRRASQGERGKEREETVVAKFLRQEQENPGA